MPFAVAAIRDGGRVRALVSATTTGDYPEPIVLPPTSPDEPPILKSPFPLPQDGWLLRETAAGWHDVERGRWRRSGPDAAALPDALLAFLVDANGHGWAVGGVTGADRSGLAEQRTQTAGIVRLGGDGGPPPGAATGDIALSSGVVRFAAGGNAVCRQACSDLADQRLGPDVGSGVGADPRRCAGRPAERPARLPLHGWPRGPGRAPRLNRRRLRYARIAGSTAIPFYPALSGGDSEDGALDAFRSAFAPFPAPLGTGPSPRGFESGSLPGAPGGDGARTHYAFDSFGSDGAVRVIVIDNGAGSLAAADAHQSPQEDQPPLAARGPAGRQGARRAGDRRQAAAISTRRCRAATPPTTPTRSRASWSTRAPRPTSTTALTRAAARRSPPAPPTGSGDLDRHARLRRSDPAKRRLRRRRVRAAGDRQPPPRPGDQPRPGRGAADPGARPAGRRPGRRRTADAAAGRSCSAVWGADRRAASCARPTPRARAPARTSTFRRSCARNNGCPDRIAPEYSFSSSDPDIGDFVARDPPRPTPRRPARSWRQAGRRPDLGPVLRLQRRDDDGHRARWWPARPRCP